MSYDFEIASDRQYTHATDGQALQTWLTRLPSIHCMSDGCCAYSLPPLNLFMYLYLEYIDAQEGSSDLYDPKLMSQVNCVRLCVPYAHFHRDERDQHYRDVGRSIARYLGWRCYDKQLDVYIDEYYCIRKR